MAVFHIKRDRGITQDDKGNVILVDDCWFVNSVQKEYGTTIESLLEEAENSNCEIKALGNSEYLIISENDEPSEEDNPTSDDEENDEEEKEDLEGFDSPKKASKILEMSKQFEPKKTAVPKEVPKKEPKKAPSGGLFD